MQFPDPLIVGSFTWILLDVLTPFDVAVIVTVPAPTPVTFPPLTFAIFVLPEVHATASFPTVYIDGCRQLCTASGSFGINRISA